MVWRLSLLYILISIFNLLAVKESMVVEEGVGVSQYTVKRVLSGH